jgi:hypothetical protein
MLLLFVSIPALLVAQEIHLRPRLLPGDEFRLEVFRSREDSNRPQSNSASRTPVDVRVVSADAKGFVVLWTPGPSEFEGAGADFDPTLGAASEIIGEQQFRIVLGPDGEFERVANEADLLPKLQAGVDLVIRAAMRDTPAAEAKRAEALVRQVLSPANLMTIATRDAQTYLSMYGAELAVGDAVEVPLSQPNPFGGDPLPAVLRVRMESASPESATISSAVVYDGDALKRMTVRIIAQAAVTPPPDEVAKFKFEMSDNAKYVFDRKSGLFREVTNDRRITSGDMRRLDRCVIRLVREPKR